MATPQEKAQCVEWFIETRSDTQVQRNFRTRYGRNPPSRTSIRELYKRFNETGSCQKQKVPVDQAQVQQTLNECVNHFDKVLENQSDAHPENWDFVEIKFQVFSMEQFQSYRGPMFFLFPTWLPQHVTYDVKIIIIIIITIIFHMSSHTYGENFLSIG